MDKKKNVWIRLGRTFSWEERDAIVKEYFSSGCTKRQIWKKYTGQEKERGQLLRWMRALGYVSSETSVEKKKKFLASRAQPFERLNQEHINKDPLELQKRIEELEKQLEAAQLKAEGYELMVELAEKELNLPIRKKSGTK